MLPPGEGIRLSALSEPGVAAEGDLDGRQYRVRTNSPIYDEQLALNRYWEQIGGTVMLPGTNRADSP